MESSSNIKMSMRFADIITCFCLLPVFLFNLSTFSVGSNIFIMLVSTELDKSVSTLWALPPSLYGKYVISQSYLVINGIITINVANHVYQLPSDVTASYQSTNLISLSPSSMYTVCLSHGK